MLHELKNPKSQARPSVLHQTFIVNRPVAFNWRRSEWSRRHAIKKI